ncbi:unnamed protein product [Didymodactylos carnosus]|uniref:Uncharacterized protein n=1 Tax=Didymodactylos carnosus TaxID=1234261 RepID=A0A8S2F1J6_9BILA|nr:unnamed protein product [Didymodactylos carnosus]CAF4123659.1 unnamed protein product [Didymodactylos carnosus]
MKQFLIDIKELLNIWEERTAQDTRMNDIDFAKTLFYFVWQHMKNNCTSSTIQKQIYPQKSYNLYSKCLDYLYKDNHRLSPFLTLNTNVNFSDKVQTSETIISTMDDRKKDDFLIPNIISDDDVLATTRKTFLTKEVSKCLPVCSSSTIKSDQQPSLTWIANRTRSNNNLNNSNNITVNSNKNHFTLTQQNLLHTKNDLMAVSIDCVDWNKETLSTSSSSDDDETAEKLRHKEVDALSILQFLQEYLQNGNSDVLMDIIRQIANEVTATSNNNNNQNNNHRRKKTNSSALFGHEDSYGINTNHDKKAKKDKKDDVYKKNDKDDKKEKTVTMKKDKDSSSSKNKRKVKSKDKLSEPDADSETSGGESDAESRTPTASFKVLSPIEELAVQSSYVPSQAESASSPPFSVSVPPSNLQMQSDGSFGVSGTNISQQATYTMASSPKQQQYGAAQQQSGKQNISVQQQLQQLTQMARDGDEILITLSLNSLVSFDRYYLQQQQWLPQRMQQQQQISSMPKNLEIVAKGFARIQNEPLQMSQQPPLQNVNGQQQTGYGEYSMYSTHAVQQAADGHRYPVPCGSAGLPSMPIGLPMRPMGPSINPMIMGQPLTNQMMMGSLGPRNVSLPLTTLFLAD